MLATSDPLLRFVTDGLMATIDSYLAGSLPLHRFAWELSARVDTLSTLALPSAAAPSRTLTRLRWLLRTVELVHAARSARAALAVRPGVRTSALSPAGAGSSGAGPTGASPAGASPAGDSSSGAGPAGAGPAELTADEENTLTVALADFRAVLATLIPHNPLDPAGAARPIDVLAVVA